MFKIGDKVHITEEAARCVKNHELTKLEGMVISIEPAELKDDYHYYTCDGTLGESGLIVTEYELELVK